MRIDVVTIFPEYLAPLDVSLLGKARERGLIDVHVHEPISLADWTHDTLGERVSEVRELFVRTLEDWPSS